MIHTTDSINRLGTPTCGKLHSIRIQDKVGTGYINLATRGYEFQIQGVSYDTRKIGVFDFTLVPTENGWVSKYETWHESIHTFPTEDAARQAVKEWLAAGAPGEVVLKTATETRDLNRDIRSSKELGALKRKVIKFNDAALEELLEAIRLEQEKRANPPKRSRKK